MDAPISTWPMGVGRLVAEYDVDGHVVTTSSWFLDPGATSPDASTADHIIDQWFFSCAGELAAIMSAAAELTACSVTYGGPNFARARTQLEPVPGIWTGAQSLAVASGLRFVGQRRGRGSACVMRVPSVPDLFVADTWRLSSTGYANLLEHGNRYLDRFNEIEGYSTATILHGCLHSISAGVVIDPPVFDIHYGVTPSPRLLTIGRRLPRGRQVSPT